MRFFKKKDELLCFYTHLKLTSIYFYISLVLTEYLVETFQFFERTDCFTIIMKKVTLLCENIVLSHGK